ncbi:MAG: hypothetical protein M1823_004356 [Watsoniomyces obsoletus]|nr:MAG: hypothetical protein M1823_004356 [Watsoniomyces obsoletus]
MSLVQASHDSLPYVDADLAAADRALAAHEIEAELPSSYQTTTHPSLPPLPEPHFSELIQQELQRKASSLPLEGGIDIARYEALDPPPTDPTSDEDRPEVLAAWRETLRRTYTASSHLETRLKNLALLEEFGKNAWLVGNAQLEDILRGVEKELVETREQTDQVNKERKAAQVNAQGELEALTQTWRQGVGKVIETEVAAEALRRDILQRKRELAEGATR